MNPNQYLSNFIVNQFNVKKFQKMIKAFLNLVENFQVLIDADDYYIKITPTYEIKVGGSKKPTSSKIESFVFNQYNTIEKQKELLLKFKNALNSLNEIERKVFVSIFINNLTTADLCEDLIIYPDKLNVIKKSAIVKFCLKLGFDKFMDIFNWNMGFEFIGSSYKKTKYEIESEVIMNRVL